MVPNFSNTDALTFYQEEGGKTYRKFPQFKIPTGHRSNDYIYLQNLAKLLTDNS
jgi:hypothetical protein